MRRNNLPGEWVRIARKHRSQVPAGSPFTKFQEAMREASAEYRGRPVRSNPAGGGLIRTGIVVGLVYLVYRAIKSEQPAPDPKTS